MHTDFALILQKLFHAALGAFRSPDGVNVSTESLLEDCQQSIKDLATMLFEYYGKVIVQPRRDLFSKASSLRVAQSSDTSFMTRVEADVAMESAKQAELLSVHADRSALDRRPPFNKKAKGRDGGKGGGNRKVPLSPPPSATAALAASTAAAAAAAAAAIAAVGISIGDSGELASPTAKYPSPYQPKQRW